VKVRLGTVALLAYVAGVPPDGELGVGIVELGYERA
jgi:hypothetical protein